MQPSELYRPGFVVPKDEEAEQALRNNQATQELNVVFFEIDDNGVYLSLVYKGFFSAINSTLGVFIDEHEEEIIAPQKMPLLLSIITDFTKSNRTDDSEKRFLRRLEKLASIAIEKKMPLYIIL